MLPFINISFLNDSSDSLLRLSRMISFPIEKSLSTPALEGMPVLYLTNRSMSDFSTIKTLLLKLSSSELHSINASTIEVAFFLSASFETSFGGREVFNLAN